jgi:glycosyltransferase involved in cell wall biosynthesis
MMASAAGVFPPRRVRLLQFVTNFKIGGTERQVVNLVQALDRSRFEMRVACLGRHGEFLDAVEERTGPVAEYRIHRLYSPDTLRRQAAFARDIRRHGIQLVHTYGFYPNVFGIPAARLAGVPVVLASIRDTGDHLTSGKRQVQRLCCRMAHRVLVNAEAVRQRLIAEGFEPRKIVLIRNGIDVARFRRRSDATQLRGELGLPKDVPLVAMLSRLNQMKGVEYFLEAAAIVLRRFPAARFLLVGDSEPSLQAEQYRRGVQAYAADLGLRDRAIFTGFRKDVPELLTEVNISVLPSLSEGLSNAVLEAMAAGVAVVATNVGGTPEIVRDGATGLLVPPRDADALAQAICRLLETPELARRLAEAGRRLVLQQFSLERMTRRVESLYLGLVEGTAGYPRAGAAQGTP